MKKTNVDMLNGPLFGNIVRFTIPIILSSILQLLFNAADLVVVGQFCGSVSVAAVGSTSSLCSLIVNLFVGLSVGAGVCVAQAVGSGDAERQSNTVHTAIPVAIIGGVVLTVVGVLFAPTLLEWMGTPADVIDLSSVYVRLYFCGMIPAMLYNFGAAILRAVGDTKGPLVYLTVAGILNVMLNVIFVTVLHMDVAGVALATTLSQVLSAALVLRSLARREDACRLDWRRIGIHRRPLMRILQIGLPTGVQSSLFSISNVLIQSSINSFGSEAMSGSAAAGNIEGFLYMTMYAFSQTAMNFIGQNVGARRFDRVRRIYTICLVTMLGLSAVLCVVTLLFAEPLLGVYITDSAAAVEVGMRRMLIVVGTYVICGAMDVTVGAIRGMGSSLAPMIISVVGVCGFRIAWIETVFAQHHTLDVLYMSYPISWAISFLVQLVVLVALLRRNTKGIRKV